MQGHSTNSVLLRLWHLLVKGVYVCAGEEAVLEGGYWVRPQGSQDVALGHHV